MSKEQDLQRALNRLFHKKLQATICTDGTIEAVNDDFTCDVSVGSSIFYSVPIEVLIDSQASIIGLPVIGSTCLIIFRDNQLARPQIIKIDQVDQLLINCKTNVQFNGGKLGGMVKVADIVTQLNNLENDINTLKSAVSGWSPVQYDGGLALKAATTAWAGANLQLTIRSDIENTAIQQ